MFKKTAQLARDGFPNDIDDNDDLPPLFSALPAKVLKPSTLESILPSRTFPQWISTSFQDVAQTRKPRITDMIC